MAGLAPAIHVFAAVKTWMPGTKPGHDAVENPDFIDRIKSDS
jgi:hypothetical protein